MTIVDSPRPTERPREQTIASGSDSPKNRESERSTSRLSQLGGLDAAFLFAETPTMHLHVCGLLILDTSTMPEDYSYELIRSTFAERVADLPLARQRLVPTPLNISRPFWATDPDFDIDNHLHRVALGAKGDQRSLGELAGDIASVPLRRDRPLWELWIIEGLPEEHVAILAKMHHSTIDGISGALLMGHLLDMKGPDASGTSPKKAQVAGQSHADQPHVSSLPGTPELLWRGVTSRLEEPWEIVKLVPATALRLGSTLWGLGRSREQAGAAKPFVAPRTSFNTTITAHRSIAFVDVSLGEIKTIKNAVNVTVNDVVTAIVGGALRHYLDVRDELPEKSLVAATPVSVHEHGVKGKGVTQVSVMFSALATDIDEPLERLRHVAAANARAKQIHRMVGADTLLRWAEHFWLNAFALGSRLYSALHLAEHHPVVHNLILSNVPGPREPLYLGGAHLVGLYPLGPITDGAGLNITVLSQEDRLGFGIISCPEFMPDVWDLAAAIPEALGELVSAVEANASKSRKGRRTTLKLVGASST